MLSKAALFALLSLSSLLFFPSCTPLPALISSLFHLGRGLRGREKQSEQRRRKEGAATRGHEKREEMRRNREWVALSEMLHTHRSLCSEVLLRSPVITEAEANERVAPLSSSLLFYLLPTCLPLLKKPLFLLVFLSSSSPSSTRDFNKDKKHMALVDAGPNCSSISAGI